MALDATNPNLAPADAGQARRLVAVDAELILRDRTDAAETADAEETAVALNVEKLGRAAIKIDGVCAGTVDGSNFWTLTIEAADNTGFTNATTILTRVLPAAFDYYEPIDGAQIELLRTAGEDESIYIRAKVAETGTTATSVDYGALITPC